MKYRVVRIEEISNPAFSGLIISGATPEERHAQATEPEFLYEVDLVVENEHCGGTMSLQYRYVPMLTVGAVFTMQELEDM